MRELKNLLFEAYAAAGEPSLDTITAAIETDDSLPGAPARDTVRRCISDSRAPAQQADVVSVAAVLSRMAGWEADRVTARIADLWVRARLVIPPGKPIAEMNDPFALGVHHAIGADTLLARSELSALPAYVERDHDIRLRAVAEDAQDGVSRLVMLIGGSSTGKTRACWEVLRQLPDGWRLWHPYNPDGPEAALAAIDRIEPRTVVWLDEAQNYLVTTSDLGERLAAKLSELLGDPSRAPALVLGTMWSEYWRTLTTQPDPGGHDPHPQARGLLAGCSMSLPAAFDTNDMLALTDLAAEDTRLAYAAEHAEDGAITQYLAAAPALLERYRTAPDAARALTEAAMDVRRLGHGLALPLALLEAAAPGYLSDTQWDLLDEDWLEQALAYNVRPMRGARGILTRIRPRPGQPPFSQPHYRLADYLEQHGRRHRNTLTSTGSLWDALVDHARPSDRLTLARAAQDRGMLRIAVDLYATAADQVTALRQAADLLAGAERLDEALLWYQSAADQGDTSALRWAAELLASAGRLDDALLWLERAARNGDSWALRRNAELLAGADRLDEALTWYTRAADNGDTEALQRAADRLVGAGRLDEALLWLGPAAEGGAPWALWMGADTLAKAGRLDEALSWYQRIAETGQLSALRSAAERLMDADRPDDAQAWYRRAANSGDTGASQRAADRLVRVGKGDEALDWLQPAAEEGETWAMPMAADVLARAGRMNEALTYYQRAVDNGDAGGGLHWVASRLAEAGRLDDALVWYARAAEHGDKLALYVAADRLAEAGRLDDALVWYERAAEHGDRWAPQKAANLLAEAGRLGDALDWIRRVPGNRESDALQWAASRLAEAGQLEDALVWYERAAEHGDKLAVYLAAERLEAAGRLDNALNWLEHVASEAEACWWAADLLAEADRLDEALLWYRRAADGGDPAALWWAADLLVAADRVDEALDWFELAADAGETDALSRAADRLAEAGRLEEALTWSKRGAGLGDAEALLKAVDLSVTAGRLDQALTLYERAPTNATQRICAGWLIGSKRLTGSTKP